MSLNKVQIAIVRTMKCSGVDPDTGATLLACLETEEQQWAMLDWMDAEYDKAGKYPDQTACINAVDAILEMFPGKKTSAE